MNIVLFGAVQSSEVGLEGLLAAGAPPALLVTIPRRRRRRHSDYVDLGELAESASVPVLRSATSNSDEVLEAVRRADPDYLLVLGWSQILGPELLALPRHGCIGYHPAPLPENRGRGVIPWTIVQGRAETASSFFWMTEGMDDGDLLDQHPIQVAPDETATTLYAKVLDAIRVQVPRILRALTEGDPPRAPQDHARATYCARRIPEDGRLDFRRPAREVWTLIRASTRPYPGAFTHLEGTRLRVWSAEYLGPGPHWATPGQVVEVGDAGWVVQCGDREHVRLVEVEAEADGEARVSPEIRLHARLGGPRATD